MTCRELIDFIMSYLGGELEGERRAEFDRHLEGCEGCRDYLASFKATVRLSQSLCPPTDPPAHDRAYKEPSREGADAQPAEETLPEELVQAILAAAGRPLRSTE